MHHGLPGMIGQPVRSHATGEVGSVLESVPFLREKRHVREKAHKPATATLTLAQVSIFYAVCDNFCTDFTVPITHNLDQTQNGFTSETGSLPKGVRN